MSFCPDCTEEKQTPVKKADEYGPPKLSPDAQARLEFATKWAEKQTQEHEMVKVKDLQYSRALDTEWLGRFRINWYIDKQIEDDDSVESLSPFKEMSISRSHFIHVKKHKKTYKVEINYEKNSECQWLAP